MGPGHVAEDGKKRHLKFPIVARLVTFLATRVGLMACWNEVAADHSSNILKNLKLETRAAASAALIQSGGWECMQGCMVKYMPPRLSFIRVHALLQS